MMSAAPPFWQVDVQKQLGTEYWTNVYHVARSNQASARLFAEKVIALEREFHHNLTVFTSYRVTPFPGPAEGTVVPVGLFGIGGAGPYLPLFCCLRADFPAPTGRPSRKYWRLPIEEVAQVNGQIEPTFVSAWQGVVDAFFASPDSAGMIDIDGQLLTSGRILPAVAMRQLRRGSRRRITPVIPVS
jgi:hypothetical protein